MRGARVLVAIVATSLLAVGAVGEMIATDEGSATFAVMSRIDDKLKRGISMKADVRRLLGTPQGDGECFLPGQSSPREVWFYEDIALLDVEQRPGYALVNMRQQFLLVFFDGDKFDGYLWTSNAIPSMVE